MPRARVGLAMMLVAVVFLPALADPVTVTVYTAPSGTNYALTPGEGGSCVPVTGGMECTSSTGGSSASTTGCGAVDGTAFCLIVPLDWTWSGGTTVNSTSTLECKDKGKSYELSTGTTTGSCTPNNGEAMTCTDNGTNTASATCENGCGKTTGAGSCKLKKK